VRAAIDVSPLAQTRAGTARYLHGLLEALCAHGGVEVAALAFGGPNRAATVVRDALWYPFGLPRRVSHSGAAVLHCPTFRAPLSLRVPLVVTVHDLAVLRFPWAFNAWSRAYSRIAVPRVVHTADAVIAVSEFTKRELVELLDIPPERIRVIPNAAAEIFRPDGETVPGEYVLAVGTLEPRKNLPALAQAARRAGVELRIAGRRGWGDVELSGDVSWLGEVPDPELAALYRGALCVAYPSLYEGFGLPVLEAMACGAAVVTSSGSATEEVAGSAAVLVDPRDPEAIAAGIQEALGRRDELRAAGIERARAYSWRDVADRTVALYRDLL
jgi:glycosyltransferase involved in cell wall biosynthesis